MESEENNESGIAMYKAVQGVCVALATIVEGREPLAKGGRATTTGNNTGSKESREGCCACSSGAISENVVWKEDHRKNAKGNERGDVGGGGGGEEDEGYACVGPQLRQQSVKEEGPQASSPRNQSQDPRSSVRGQSRNQGHPRCLGTVQSRGCEGVRVWGAVRGKGEWGGQTVVPSKRYVGESS